MASTHHIQWLIDAWADGQSTAGDAVILLKTADEVQLSLLWY
jgi:hypothetical protein